MAPGELPPLLEELLGRDFASAHLFTSAGSWQLERRRKGWRLSQARAAAPAPAGGHDRAKDRAVSLDPRWLGALGVLDAKGRPKRGMEAKRRQIHRFAELLEHLLGKASGPLRLVDMGCGKGYLTFAAYELLRQRDGAAVVTGVERRPELAAASEALARRLGYEGLSFVPGDIADVPLAEVDVVVALHACDTATDDALARGVEAKARFLVVAPCCHKELRPQLASPEGLDSLLHHGVLRTRQADMVTDALRASLLEASGYRARVVEFISPEHTDKNLMITAERRDRPRAGAEEEPRRLARAFGVHEQRLAGHLAYPLR